MFFLVRLLCASFCPSFSRLTSANVLQSLHVVRGLWDIFLDSSIQNKSGLQGCALKQLFGRGCGLKPKKKRFRLSGVWELLKGASRGQIGKASAV